MRMVNGNVEVMIQLVPEAYAAVRATMERDRMSLADAVNVGVITLDEISKRAKALGKSIGDAMEADDDIAVGGTE